MYNLSISSIKIDYDGQPVQLIFYTITFIIIHKFL